MIRNAMKSVKNNSVFIVSETHEGSETITARLAANAINAKTHMMYLDIVYPAPLFDNERIIAISPTRKGMAAISTPAKVVVPAIVESVGNNMIPPTMSNTPARNHPIRLSIVIYNLQGF